MQIINNVKTQINDYFYNKYKLKSITYDILPTNNLNDGDYYTNVALKYAGQLNKNPLNLANELASIITEPLIKVVVVKPGFINLFLTDKYFKQNLSSVHKYKSARARGKVIVEYVSPNTNKPLHIGHARNCAIGTSLINILEADGFNVKKAVIYNNRGLHIIKSMWGYLLLGSKINLNENTSWQEALNMWCADADDWLSPSQADTKRLQKPDHFVGYYYVLADSFSENKKAQSDWQQMLLAFEDSKNELHSKVISLWEYVNNYFYKGYKQTAKNYNFGFNKDYISYEDKLISKGKKIIQRGVKKGVFKKLKNGAIEADLSKFNLPNKVLVRGDGTGIYMTFDLALTKKRSKSSAKKLIWVVGDDQNLYFKQLFAVAQLLGYGNTDKFLHYSYGMVRLPQGKMSSRKGKVIYADDLLAEVKKKVNSIMESSNIGKDLQLKQKKVVINQVALGAIKWTMLSNEAKKPITFDINQTVSFSGFSGPYVQYTYARANSVLNKSKVNIQNLQLNIKNEDEKNLLRLLNRFNAEVKRAKEELAPHYICHYLYDLCQNFNSFYGKHKILKSTNEGTRLILCNLTAKVIKNGLFLLAIDAPKKM